jgi:hypothetical protein
MKNMYMKTAAGVYINYFLFRYGQYHAHIEYVVFNGAMGYK